MIVGIDDCFGIDNCCSIIGIDVVVRLSELMIVV